MDIEQIEQLALGVDRSAALATLLPGTAEHDYWRGVFLQHAGRLDEVEEILNTWQARHGGSWEADNHRQRLERRQLLLRSQRDLAKTAEELRRELGLALDDRAEVVVQAQHHPTKLDPRLVDGDLLVKEQDRRRGDLSGITDWALEGVAPLIQDGDVTRRRNLLSRLWRTNLPDVNVVDIIARDFADNPATTFGSLPIHHRLTIAQLEELASKRKELRTQATWVDAMLTRHRPPSWVDLRFDRDERTAFLDRIWPFVSTLAPSFNTLKAEVLLHQLELGRSRGVYDRSRFLAYIELPRNASWVARDWLARHSADQLVRPNVYALRASGLEPSTQDDALVRDFLAHFLRTEDGSAFRQRISSEVIDEVLATTRLLNGDPEPERWAKVLGTSRLTALRDRVDIELAPQNRVTFAADDDVTLEVDVKNVKELEVKVFRINTLAYFQSKNAEVDTSLDLDGMVPSGAEQKLRFENVPPMRRTREKIALPACKRPGTYIVELIGNGRSSRALIRKGSLRHVVRTGSAGLVVRVMDENGTLLPDARIWLSGRELSPREDGLGISIPFSTRPGATPILLVHGEVAQRAVLDHPAEVVQLRAGFHLERESLVANQIARVVCRPSLTIAGAPASVTLIEEPSLDITVTDLAGTSSSKTQPVTLTDNQDAAFDINIPDGITYITVNLRGRVRVMSTQQTVDVSDGAGAAVNLIHTSEETKTLHLARVGDAAGARYVLNVLGKTGEPLAAHAISLTLYHRSITPVISVMLETDAEGAVDLGPLEGVTAMTAALANGQRTWSLVPEETSPPALVHAAVGDAIALPLKDGVELRDVTLTEVRGSAPAFDRTSHVKLVDRCLVVEGLEAGEFQLTTRGQRTAITIAVAPRSATNPQWAIAGNSILEITPPLPLLRHLGRESGKDGESLRIRVSGATSHTRVHVIATRFVSDRVLSSTLLVPPTLPLWARSTRAISHYVSGRDIGEEYRYVLERRHAQRRPGTMLDKPGLLLNPWSLRTTSTAVQTALGGMAYPQSPPAPAPARGGMPGPAGSPYQTQAGAAEQPGFPTVDFLMGGAVVLDNRVLDESGELRIPIAELGSSAQMITVIVVDPSLTSIAHLPLPPRTATTRDLRLRLALDPKHHYAEDRRVDGVPSGTTVVVDDVRTGKIQLVDSIKRAHQLLLTLTGDDEALREFSFVAEWMSLDDATKRAKYSKYACHELHLFLWRKDPSFFSAVVQPYLAHKRDKTFIDRFLLGENLGRYLDPWAFGKLNTVERILLAMAVAPVKDGVARLIGDAVDLIARDPEEDARLVSTLLGASALESAPDTGRPPPAEIAAYEAADLLSADEETTGTFAPSKMKKMAKADMARAEAAPAPRAMRAPMAAAPPAQAASTLTGGGGYGVNQYLADAREREKAPAMFRSADKTQEWAETSWWRRRIDEMDADMIAPNRFWRDFAKHVHGSGEPFLSPHLGDCASSFAEAMCVLAFLDLPFVASKHESSVEETRLTITTKSHALAARTSIVEIQAAEESKRSPVLIGQSYFRSDDRWEWDGAEQREKYVLGEMIAGVVYRCQVVVTNPTSARQKLDVLMQIPRGAVPVANGFFTRTTSLRLDPYGTHSLEYAFYFPRAGRFTHFPAHVTKGLELQTFAEPREIEVVREPTAVDHGSWSHVSQHGTTDEVIAFLGRSNIGRVDLARIAWRMHDRDAFTRITKHLAERYVYDDGLWAYALMHKDPVRAWEWLRHQDEVLRLGGPLFAASANGAASVEIDPIARGWYQHLEYAPLINARAHQLGARRRILNSALEEQYKAFLDVVAHRPQVTPDDIIAGAHYLLCMDRVEDAIALLTRAPKDNAGVATRMQLDYLLAYVACYRGDLSVARKHAAPWAEHPVDRWRHRFAALVAMLDEAEGTTTAEAPPAARAVDPDSREQKMAESAAREPSLELTAKGDELIVQHVNLTQCQLRFYRMDIELLFSRQPFVQGDVDRFSFIEPGLVLDVALTSTGRSVVPIPADLRGSNLVIEATAGVGGGLRRTVTHYAHDLAVQVAHSFGQVRVLRGTTQKALPATYVKVYGRTTSGTVAFFKDGYTDMRGRFDYATLSTDDLDRVDRLAILIASDDAGATIVEAPPPPR